MSGLRVLVLLAVAALGAGGTFALSEALRNDARRGWETEAEQAAQSLSGSLLGWLEESYAPLSGIAALVENSDSVTETEFLNAFDGLEARATAFFLDAAALAAPAPDGDSVGWRIKYSTDPEGFLSLAESLAGHPEILEAVTVAEGRFGEIILGRPVRAGDGARVVSPVALGTYDRNGPLVVIGLVDYVDLAKGLFDLHVPEGVTLRIVGQFLNPNGRRTESAVIGKPSQRALYSATTRTVSAGAELAITWNFDGTYEGGPPRDLADPALITGLTGVALITLIVGLLQQTRARARSAETAKRRLENEIEQRAVAEEEVRRMSKVFMDAADPILIEGLDGVVVEMNAEAERAYGWSREELIGQPITRIVPPERHDQAKNLLRRCLAGGEVRNLEGLRWRKDGERLTVLLTLSRLTDESGEAVAVATLAKDISELKEAEQELQRMSKVFMDAADPILVESLDGIVVEMNAETEKAYGWSRDELIGQPIIQIVPPERHDQAKDLLRRCLAGDEVRNVEGLRWGKDGERLAVLLTLSRLTDESGEAVAVATLAKDITELKEAERKLQRHSQELEDRVHERTRELSAAKEQAEEATRAKSSFLAAMSHEIRTPMNGVVGMIDLLRETKLDTDQRQMMGTVRDSAYSLLQIINDILDFSKIEAGKLNLEAIPISVRDAVEGVGETLAPNAVAKGIVITTFVDPDIPDWVIGDQVRLRQVLFNIGGNAVKFTENQPGKQGRVSIRADLVADGDDSRAAIRYSVADNGIGIPEEAQEKLFEAFTQAESSTTRRFGGTGLGLSICVRLADLMDGRIAVDSEPGRGSTFTVTIHHGRSDKKSERGDGRDLNGVRVLLVAAMEETRTSLTRYLTHWGAEVASVDNIGAAHATAVAAAAAPFHTVAVGMDWTGEEKADLRRSFGETPELADTRFVFLERGRRRSARQLDADTVIVDAAPTHRAAFLSAVAVSVGRASPEIKAEKVVAGIGRGKAPTVEEAERSGQLILIAEDNVTNQDVIRRQLNLLGYAAEIHEDGVKTLKAWKRKNYALLLSDCHMPNMDGFELTAAIRAGEDPLDPRFPIIAITANALQGEADRCLAAGMDDYLSKPLEMNQLRTVLKKWMPATAAHADVPAGAPLPAPPAAAADRAAPGGAAIDLAALSDIFGNDADLLKDILNDFIEPATDNVKEITDACTERSSAAVGAAAHKLKSSSRAVGANALADLCQALEKAGKADDWEEIDQCAPSLDGVFRAVVASIQEM